MIYSVKSGVFSTIIKEVWELMNPLYGINSWTWWNLLSETVIMYILVFVGIYSCLFTENKYFYPRLRYKLRYLPPPGTRYGQRHWIFPNTHRLGTSPPKGLWPPWRLGILLMYLAIRWKGRNAKKWTVLTHWQNIGVYLLCCCVFNEL